MRYALLVLLAAGITQHIEPPMQSIAITHGEGKSLFACIKAMKGAIELTRAAWHPRGEPAIPRKQRDQAVMEASARASLDAVDDACGVGTEGEP
jgi:hypothetical protein